jgi:FixJ family two-component response regulator
VPDPVGSWGEVEYLRKLPLPDLILMDIALFWRYWRHRNSPADTEDFRSPIIFISTHSDVDRFAPADKTKPAGFIVKPYNG